VEEAPCALYLVEEADNDEDEESELVNPQQGRRIVALSLQGNTLQVYTNPVEGHTFSNDLRYFDGKLLAPVKQTESNGLMVHVGVMAFSGAWSLFVYCGRNFMAGRVFVKNRG